jgi:hypothetical protein
MGGVILAVAIALWVSLHALGIADRAVGGATLAGWLTVALLTWLLYGDGQLHPARLFGEVHPVAGAVLLASLVLAVVYARRRQRT